MRFFILVVILVLSLFARMGEVRANCGDVPLLTDRVLAETLSVNIDTIVYVWSPLMVLSSIGREEVENLRAEGFAVLTAMDPSARLCSVAPTEPRLASNFLFSNSALNHFPTLFYLRGAEVVLTLHGYESYERLLGRLISVRAQVLFENRLSEGRLQ